MRQLNVAGRPRPVLIYAAIMAGLAAITGFGSLGDLIPATAVKWLMLVEAVVAAVGGVLVQGLVTPVSDPQDNQRRKLVPAEADNRS